MAKKDKPILLCWSNLNGMLEIKIQIGKTEYTYIHPYTVWLEKILHKKYFGFRDLNVIKKNARLVSEDTFYMAEIPRERISF